MASKVGGLRLQVTEDALSGRAVANIVLNPTRELVVLANAEATATQVVLPRGYGAEGRSGTAVHGLVRLWQACRFKKPPEGVANV